MVQKGMTRMAAIGLALGLFGFGAWLDRAPASGSSLPPEAPPVFIATLPAPIAAPSPAAFAPPAADTPARVAATALTPLPATRPPVATSRFGLPCGLTIAAEARPAATVLLQVSDPCRAETQLEIAHEGLTFTLRTDLTGAARVALPALADPAVIGLRFPGEASRSVSVAVPDMADYDRVAIASDFPGLALHARERGAAYGEPGHVWSGNPGTEARAIRGEGGYVALLGTEAAGGRLAQVYTFPRDPRGGGGTVRLTVEMLSGPESCGRAGELDTLHLREDGGVALVSVGFQAPGCDAAAGQLTVLQNLFRDLRIAAN